MLQKVNYTEKVKAIDLKPGNDVYYIKTFNINGYIMTNL